MLIILSMAAWREGEMTYLEAWYKEKDKDFFKQFARLGFTGSPVYTRLIKSPEWLAKDFAKVEAKMYEEVGLMICKRAIKNI